MFAANPLRQKELFEKRGYLLELTWVNYLIVAVLLKRLSEEDSGVLPEEHVCIKSVFVKNELAVAQAKIPLSGN